MNKQKNVTYEFLRSIESYLNEDGYIPEDFIRTIDHVKIAICPSDNPHPHRLSVERHTLIPYQYSVGLNHAIIPSVGDQGVPSNFNAYKDLSSQVLCGDGLDYLLQNFKARYLEVPDCSWDQPHWYSNTVGYFHAGARAANMAVRDLSVRSVNYGMNGIGIDTDDIFFYKRGESLDAYFGQN